MKNDLIQYEILEDGTVSVDTDAISGTNHISADKLLARLFDFVGGPVSVKKKSRLGHSHAHDHQHVAGGHVH